LSKKQGFDALNSWKLEPALGTRRPIVDPSPNTPITSRTPSAHRHYNNVIPAAQPLATRSKLQDRHAALSKFALPGKMARW
jgi:hypothetical protein